MEETPILEKEVIKTPSESSKHQSPERLTAAEKKELIEATTEWVVEVKRDEVTYHVRVRAADFRQQEVDQGSEAGEAPKKSTHLFFGGFGLMGDLDQPNALELALTKEAKLAGALSIMASIDEIPPGFDHWHQSGEPSMDIDARMILEAIQFISSDGNYRKGQAGLTYELGDQIKIAEINNVNDQQQVVHKLEDQEEAGQKQVIQANKFSFDVKDKTNISGFSEGAAVATAAAGEINRRQLAAVFAGEINNLPEDRLRLWSVDGTIDLQYRMPNGLKLPYLFLGRIVPHSVIIETMIKLKQMEPDLKVAKNRKEIAQMLRRQESSTSESSQPEEATPRLQRQFEKILGQKFVDKWITSPLFAKNVTTGITGPDDREALMRLDTIMARQMLTRPREVFKAVTGYFTGGSSPELDEDDQPSGGNLTRNIQRGIGDRSWPHFKRLWGQFEKFAQRNPACDKLGSNWRVDMVIPRRDQVSPWEHVKWETTRLLKEQGKKPRDYQKTTIQFKGKDDQIVRQLHIAKKDKLMRDMERALFPHAGIVSAQAVGKRGKTELVKEDRIYGHFAPLTFSSDYLKPASFLSPWDSPPLKRPDQVSMRSFKHSPAPSQPSGAEDHKNHKKG